MEIFSMIAADPRMNGPLSPGGPEIRDGNVAVNDVSDVINHQTNRLPAAAKGLLEIARGAHSAEADVIQLIGHGCSGVLSLGYYWSRIYTHEDTACQVLDGNPYAYYSLDGKIVRRANSHPDPVVLLIGCYVGSPESNGTVATGMTLLVDLEQMWKCRVYAAESYVVPSQFVNGIYMGPLRASDGEIYYADQVLGAGAPVTMEDRKDAFLVPDMALEPAQFRFRSLTSIPMLGPNASKGLAFLSQQNQEFLSSGIYRQVDVSPLLALPEMEFRIVRQGAEEECAANLCCGGRLLRVGEGDGIKTFQMPVDLFPVSSLYRSIIRDSLFGPA